MTSSPLLCLVTITNQSNKSFFLILESMELISYLKKLLARSELHFPIEMIMMIFLISFQTIRGLAQHLMKMNHLTTKYKTSPIIHSNG